MTPWFVYILQCQGGSLYTGITKNIKKRFGEHANGKGGAYTRAHLPIRIVYQEPQPSRSAALVREAHIKRWSRATKIRNLKIRI